MPNRKLTLDLESDYEKEDRQEPVVYPVEQCQAECGCAPLESEGGIPPGLERRSEGWVTKHQREQRRQAQKQTRRWSPANKLERSSLNPVAQWSEHRIGQRSEERRV